MPPKPPTTTRRDRSPMKGFRLGPKANRAMSSAGQAARKNPLLIAGVILAALLWLPAWYQVIRDHQNPGAWIVFYMWGIPLTLTLFYAMRPGSTEKRRFKTIALGVTMLLTIFTLAFTLVVPQLTTFVAWLLWGPVLLLGWSITLGGIDYAFDGMPHKYCWAKLRAGAKPGR